MHPGILHAAWVALVASAVGCTTTEGFACGEDNQCLLGGTPGICVPETSQCAYPDEQCEGGYSYPMGAGTELGGACVGGPSATGTSAGTNGPGSTPGTTDSMTTVGGTVSAESSGTVGVVDSTAGTASTGPGVDSTATDGPGPTTGETTTGPMCPVDGNETNDTVATATTLVVSAGCTATASGVLEPGDTDWFEFDAPNNCFNVGVSVSWAAPMSACILVDGCPLVDTMCPAGAVGDTVKGISGCCSATSLMDAILDCPGMSVYYLEVRGAAECVEYDVSIAEL